MPTLVSVPSVTPWLLWMNNTKAPFNDKKVRQALAYGLDKEGIAKNLLKGLVEPAWQLISPLSWAYNPNVVKHKFDQAKAKQLLDEAGWKVGADGIREKDGNKLSFEILNIAGEQERIQILSFAQRQWKEIGVDAKIKAGGRRDHVGQRAAQAHLRDGLLLHRPPGRPRHGDPLPVAGEAARSANFAGYSNPEVDKLLDEALQTVDRSKRKENYFKAQEIVAEDVVYLFLFWLTNHTAMNKRVQGYKAAPGYAEFWNIDEWWLDK